MSSNKHLKEEAISLRKKGKSYNDIRKSLGIKSKGTISYWFRNLKLSKKSEKLLEKNKKLAHERGLFIANKERTERIVEENDESYKNGKGCISTISEYELLVIGASLYWAEGMKSERTPNPSVTFSNSDPSMVSAFMRFVREILKIPEERIRAGIHIYPTIRPEDARRFWSDITKLPINRFYIITQVSRASQGKRPYNILPYGTAVIKINNRIEFHKVKGMIAGIIEKLTK
jgi:hypothetical protein